MTTYARLLTAALGLLLAVSGALAPLPATALEDEIAAAAAPKRGVVKVVVKAPRGVPATVLVRSTKKPRKAGNTVTVAKPARGKKTVKRVRLPAGRVTVVAQDLVHAGKIYRVRASKRLTVRTRGTTRLTVRYRAVRKAPRNLRAATVQRTRVGLAWQGTGGKKVRVVRTTGTVAAASPGKGTRVPVKRRTVTDTAVKPGNSYTYALFFRVGKKWAGPLSVTLGTPAVPSARSSATYTLSPGTRVLAASEIAAARYLPSGVVVTTRSSTPLVIGQLIGLPITRVLRHGFLGRVSSISADGSATAVPVPMGLAYSDLDFRGQLKPSPQKLVPTRPAATQGLLDKNGSTCLSLSDFETDADGIEAEVDPIFDSTGEIKGKRVGLGAHLQADLTFTVGLQYGIDSDAEASCEITFKEFVKPVVTPLPIPLLLTLSPHVEVSTSGRVAFDAVATSATANMTFDATVSKDGATGDADWDTTFQAFDEPPAFSAEAQASVGFGGSLTVGPGVGNAWAGVTAGIKGKVDLLALSASASVTVPTSPDAEPEHCFSVSAGGKAELLLTAKAWIPGKELFNKDYPLPGLEKDWSYGKKEHPHSCRSESGSIGVIGSDDSGALDAHAVLKGPLEELGYQVFDVQSDSAGLYTAEVLEEFDQVWLTAQYLGWLPEGLSSAIATYVAGGGSVMMSGQPEIMVGRPSADEETEGGLHVVNQLLDGTSIRPDHLCYYGCDNVAPQPIRSRMDDVDVAPVEGAALRMPVSSGFSGIEGSNRLTVATAADLSSGGTWNPSDSVTGGIWEPLDLVGRQGRLVALSSASWLEPEHFESNQAFLRNIAFYLAQ